MEENKEKSVGLTELADVNSQLNYELERHTKSRNYLWKIATGEAEQPKLTLQPEAYGNDAYAEIDMHQLPTEVSETILIMTIDHEEKMAFDIWKQILENATAACKLIEKIETTRDEHEEKQILTMPE